VDKWRRIKEKMEKRFDPGGEKGGRIVIILGKVDKQA
jgi:hypothetical protein